MPEAQTTAARTATAPLQSIKRKAPETVREARIGSVLIRLKLWANGQHSLEISQKDRRSEAWHQISFGEFEATGVADAIGSLVSIARK